MNDLTRDSMQALLDKMAKTHSSSVVGHVRWYLSGIFKMALGEGIRDIGLKRNRGKPFQDDI